MGLATTVVVRDALRGDAPTAMVLVNGQPFQPLLDYMRELARDFSSDKHCANAVARFINWLTARGHEFKEQKERSSLYTSFINDIRYGTIKGEEDPTGLWWKATSIKNARMIGRHLVDFSDWLSDRHGAAHLNPLDRPASVAEQMVFWRAWNRRRAGSMFAHLKSDQDAEEQGRVARRHALPGRVPKHGQVCMHHNSPLSQQIYRELQASGVAAALQDALGGRSLVAVPRQLSEGLL